MKTVALVPIKMNNERTPGKNTMRFDDGTPLIHFILKTLLEVKNIDEVYVYCSKDEIKEYLLPDVKFIKRDEKYDSKTADVNDMFYSFAKTVKADIYVLAHATAPFLLSDTIEKGINIVETGEYDSAVAVRKMQEFLWADGNPLNYSLEKIPRTQDLEPIYVETTGLYIYKEDVICEMRRRIGKKPYMLEVDLLEATDINNPIDFEIANVLYSNIIKKRN